MTTAEIRYSDHGTPLSGVMVSDHALPDARPGVLIVHGGAGLDAHARTQAGRFADAGYVAFACDMYGDGVRGNRERVLSEIKALRADRHRLRSRAAPAIEVLRSHPRVNDRLAIVGYCFGGLVALELARGGIDVAAIVSVHGTLTTTQPVEAGAIRTPILACQGALDPHCSLSDALGFAGEMKRIGADWEMVIYGNAMHGFTHEDAKGQMPGVLYDADADTQSTAAIRAFLARAFERSGARTRD